MSLEDIKIYLPKYLSESSKNALLDSLRDFPVVPDDRFYTSKLTGSSIIYQGDGLNGFVFVQLPELTTRIGNALILSNTCDMAKENVRFFSSQIVYAPIIGLATYRKILREEGITPLQIRDHIRSIKNQSITQVFYLPELPNVIDESIVFFDRVYNIDNTYVPDVDINDRRLFTLSDFGAYLLLFKLSFHFCRIQDQVDRNKGG